MSIILRISISSLLSLISYVGHGQSKINVQPSDEYLELKWSHDSTFKVKLTIINNTASTILVPASPYAYSQKSMGVNNIGIKLKFGGSNMEKYCAPLIQYIIPPNMVEIPPGSSREIKVTFPGDYFVRSGRYTIKYYLMLAVQHGKRVKYKYYSSKKIVFNLI